MTYEIVEISPLNKHFHNKSVESFDVFGRLEASFQNNMWHHRELIFDSPYTKLYAEEDLDLDDYIESSTKTIFYALSDGEVIGQIVIRNNWNKFCFIDDIAVCKSARHKGIASSLIKEAQNWAVKNDLKGLMLETQDINLAACKLYSRNGFEIGSVDTMLYHNLETKGEMAIIWYKRFC